MKLLSWLLKQDVLWLLFTPAPLVLERYNATCLICNVKPRGKCTYCPARWCDDHPRWPHKGPKDIPCSDRFDDIGTDGHWDDGRDRFNFLNKSYE